LRWTLTSAAPADEPQIVELGHLVLHQGSAVAQLRAKVLVVARSYGHGRAVRNLAERHHLERHRKRLVGPPVRGQYGAHQERTAGAHQLARMLGQEIAQRPFGQYVGGHLGVRVRQAVVGGRGTGSGGAGPAASHLGTLDHHPATAVLRGRRSR